MSWGDPSTSTEVNLKDLKISIFFCVYIFWIYVMRWLTKFDWWNTPRIVFADWWLSNSVKTKVFSILSVCLCHCIFWPTLVQLYVIAFRIKCWLDQKSLQVPKTCPGGRLWVGFTMDTRTIYMYLKWMLQSLIHTIYDSINPGKEVFIPICCNMHYVKTKG